MLHGFKAKMQHMFLLEGFQNRIFQVIQTERYYCIEVQAIAMALRVINTIWRLVCHVCMAFKAKCSACFYLKDFRITG